MLPHPQDVADQSTIVPEHRIADRKGVDPYDCAVGRGDPPIETSGRDLPEHLRAEPAPVRPALSDPTSQRLALLLSLHPELDREYRDIDLRKMSAAARRHMLDAINRRLNIPSPA
jgi:hypothetical protein